MGHVLLEWKKRGTLSPSHLCFGVTKYLEGFSETIIDIPHAGLYLGSIVASAWLRDQTFLPPLAFLKDCGLLPVPDGEEADEYDIDQSKKCMAVLLLQIVESVHKEALLVGKDATEAELIVRGAIASTGLSEVCPKKILLMSWWHLLMIWMF